MGHVIVALCVLVLAACSESSTVDPDTGPGITFDATLPSEIDAGPPETDAGPPESDIGTGCTADSDCDGGVCVTESDGFAGGYCSAFCVSDEDCEGASICVEVGGGTSLCFDTCDPDVERDCRAGYGCGESFMLPAPVCLPGCVDDTDCPSDATCNPAGGGLGEGSCYNAGASVGDACEASIDCPDETFCFAERFAGWPGGACIAFGCDPDANTGCPTGSHCIRGRRGGRCFPSCVDGMDCRDAYACLPDDEFTDRSICQPACADATNCSGGRTCDAMTGRCE